MKTRCSHSEEDLILYFYNELDEEALAGVHTRLEACPSCREAYRSLQQMEAVLPRSPSFEPAPPLREVLRRNVRTAVRRPERSPVRTPRFGLTPSAIFVRAAVVLGLLLMGYVLGSWRGASPSAAPEVAEVDLAGLFLGGGPVQATDGRIAPAAMEIEEVAFDPASGQVRVRFHTVNDVLLHGDLNAPVIRDLLQRALLDENNQAARLRAMKVLQQAGAGVNRPDDTVVDALLALIDKETNEGMRLKALQALHSLHQAAEMSPRVKASLIHVLLNDRNEALRIEALRALTERSGSEAAGDWVLKAALDDANGYIRYRAATLLEAAGPGTALEAIPSIENEP